MRHLVRYDGPQRNTLCGILLIPTGTPHASRHAADPAPPKADDCDVCWARHEVEVDDHAAEYVYDDDLVRC